jgi:2-polyprenyl-6-methoxyphenol hydroxylase-like FAD-dependent oxidoreductase
MISSRTMLILENICLHEEILSKGTVVECGTGFFNQRQIGMMSMNLIDDPTIRYPFPFVLPQPDIEEAFEHVLNKRGGKIERGCEVVKVDTLKDYVEVTLKSGEVIKAMYVVGCDGAHSVVRHAQPWKFEGRPVNMLWAQCDGLVKEPNVKTTRASFFLGKTGSARIRPAFLTCRLRNSTSFVS